MAIAASQGIGVRLPRKEDERFLTGRGRFIDDMPYPDALQCVFLRSPHAHAEIISINCAQARQAPGVVGVFTGANMAADGIGPMQSLWRITSKDGSPMAEPPRWALARGRVRHVGEPVAVVVAATYEQALDAAAQIIVKWDERPALADARQALLPNATDLHDVAPGNVCFRWERGDAAAVETAMRTARQIVEININNNRLFGGAMETRGVIASFNPASMHCTLFTTTQAPHHIRKVVAEQTGLSEAQIRIVSPDMGGGFGNKGKHYPEETALVWASMKLLRPLKWIGQRSESFQSDTQARDHHTRARLAVNADGQFLGLEVNTIANLGAYVSTFGANIPSAIYSALLSGVYTTPAIHVEVTGVFTNTLPTDAYRGAGRPEACFVLERLADKAAGVLGMDRIAIRKRNMIKPEQMPYITAIGPTYDSGDFPGLLDKLRRALAYDTFEDRRMAALRNGRYIGIGIASFVESSGVAPSKLGGALGARVGFFETARIRVNADGSMQAALGTHNHGQGHETSFAQILSHTFGVPVSRIQILEGDSDAVPNGTGTFGSRSIAVGGTALVQAANTIIEKGKRIAAHVLGVQPSQLSFEDGIYSVYGSNRHIDFENVAAAAHAPFDFPNDAISPGFEATVSYDPVNFAFSNGAHAAEVEVDIETGSVRLLSYCAVDDIGTVINPMIAEGQIHGGIAQGAGQALMEHCIYEDGSAQLTSGSFMDYAMPRADDLPFFASSFDQTQPCTHNLIGAKGCGESGAIAAPAAIVNAVLHALSPLGITDIEMPLTSARVWKAIRGRHYLQKKH